MTFDSYGRWGKSGRAWAQEICRSASSSQRDYSFKVNAFRTAIAVAHAKAIGRAARAYLARDFIH